MIRHSVVGDIAILRAYLLAIAGSVLLTACASSPPLVEGRGLTVIDATQLPPPMRIDLASDERPYLLGPFDKISITVFGVEDLSREEVQADASGRISLPLIGTIEAAGRSPAELATMIEDALRDRFVKNPQVNVNLVEAVSQVVTVDGQVREPGLYPVVGRMTLIRAIATAKGTTEFAELDEVVVFRTVNNQRMAALYNLDAIRRGLYEDPEIFANDVIVVGDSPARRLFRDVLQAAPLITAPIIALISYR